MKVSQEQMLIVIAVVRRHPHCLGAADIAKLLRRKGVRFALSIIEQLCFTASEAGIFDELTAGGKPVYFAEAR